jgi:tripartite-type tricarboxylate transporter receptor subunit TctC
MKILKVCLVQALLLGGIHASHAQTAVKDAYPSQPIRWIVPYSAGSGSDSAARLIAERLPALLGQPVVIDNKPGAGGVLGTDLAAKSKPDGYTMVWGGIAPLAISPALQKTMPFDSIKDFQPITRVAIAPLLLVAHPKLGVRSLSEFVALAKRKPNQLSYASPGNGTTSHLSMELLKQASGTQIAHVPYKGTTPGVADLLGGHVDVMIDSVAALAPSVNDGKLIPLAVTSGQRMAAMPQIPTIKESGFPGIQTEAWMGVLLPAGAPQQVVARLSAAFEKVLSDPEVRSTMSDRYGFDVAPTTPAQFSEFIQSELNKWARVAKAANARID